MSNNICMVLYVLVAISLAGMAPLQDFNADTALADAFASVELNYVSYIIYFCAFTGITAACFSNLLVGTPIAAFLLFFARHNRRVCKLRPMMASFPPYLLESIHELTSP